MPHSAWPPITRFGNSLLPSLGIWIWSRHRQLILQIGKSWHQSALLGTTRSVATSVLQNTQSIRWQRNHLHHVQTLTATLLRAEFTESPQLASGRGQAATRPCAHQSRTTESTLNRWTSALLSANRTTSSLWTPYTQVQLSTTRTALTWASALT